MKRRLDSTTSERELVYAMCESGRPVSLATLSIWRKEGLLPPFASQGAGRGRSYYWREMDIFARACTAFDFLKKYERTDVTLWMLWVCGFPVPPVQLRRFLLHRSRTRGLWMPRTGVTALEVIPAGVADKPSMLALSIAYCLSGIYPADEESIAIIGRVLTRLRRTNTVANTEIEGRLRLLQMLAVALESSTLVADATDDELSEAQRYLRLAASLLEDEAERDAWANWLGERVAPYLLMLILAFLKSDQRTVLESAHFQLREIILTAGERHGIKTAAE